MYLSKGQKRTIQAGLMGLSAVLLIQGGWKAIANPQTYSASDLQAIHEQGIEGKAVRLAGQKTAAVLGIVQMTFAAGCLALAGIVAESTPSRILPKQLDPADTPPEQIIDRNQTLTALRHRLVELLQDHPWLMQTIAAESLIIIAPAGAGKSSIASVIAFLRSILRNHSVHLLDPHAAINVERGIWLIGDIYQSEQEILGAGEEITARHSRSNPCTAVLDEFGSLGADKNSRTAKFASDIVGSAIRDNRKFHNHFVFLCHGRSKGQMGGEAMPSGYLDSWTHKSMVLELESDYSMWGEAEFAGRARFKPAGKAFDDDSAYTSIQIPDFLNPIAIRREFHQLFAVLGLTQAQHQEQKPQYNPTVMKLIDEALSEEHLSGVKTLLDRLYQASAEETQCTSIDPAQAVSSLSNSAVQMFRYYFDKGQKYIDSDGWLEVKILRENWAKHKGILAEQFKEILAETISTELALMQENRWKPRIAKTDLPPEDSTGVE
ncbi:ATP-binding protein [Cyanobacteria bacterium FACHB-502]|nr:ATP-binding protein [Cyanobacteria bacterium FACHB-502]